MLMKTILEAPQDDDTLRLAAEDMLRQTEAAFSDAFQNAQEAGQIATHKDTKRLASRLRAEILGLRAYAQRSDRSDRIYHLAEDIALDIEALGEHPKS